MKISKILVFLLILLNISLVYSDLILDIEMYETYYSSSNFYSLRNISDENRDYLDGYIVITNRNSDHSLQDILLELENDYVIESIRRLSGKDGYISKRQPDVNTVLLIPDLGPYDSVTFRYSVNDSYFTPVLNYSTKFDDIKILPGLSLGLTETFTPRDSYQSCISKSYFKTNSKLIQDDKGEVHFFRFTRDRFSKNLYNLRDENTTLIFNMSNGECLENKTYEISYYLQTPRVNVSGNQLFSNGSLTYEYNDTISDLNILSYNTTVDLDLEFSKSYAAVPDDNGSVLWKVNSLVTNPTNFTVNLTKVSLWVSEQGQANPEELDRDYYNDDKLIKEYIPSYLLGPTSYDWNNGKDTWFFNYSNSSSPVVWMDIDNVLVNENGQLQTKEFTQSAKNIFIKEVYFSLGYWLEITKDIEKLGNNEYRIKITVKNLGIDPTPSNEPIIAYNFLPFHFNLTSDFNFSDSNWYQSGFASKLLNDASFNGTMLQFAIIPTNRLNASLDRLLYEENYNNTWFVSYDVIGSGEFSFDDLFLTGANPIQVRDSKSSEKIEVTTGDFFETDSVGFFLGYMVIVVLLAMYFF